MMLYCQMINYFDTTATLKMPQQTVHISCVGLYGK